MAHLATLFARREQPAKWLLVVASVPSFLFALIGAAYGAALPYASLGVMCVAQVVYPTLAGWGIVLATAIFALGAYGVVALRDVLALQRGEHAGVFANTNDGFAFSALLVVLALVAIGLAISPPRKPRTERSAVDA